MAFRAGRTSSLSVGGTVIQAYLDNLALNATGETADTTVFGNTWHTALATLLGAELSGGGNYDPTATTGPMDVLWTALTGLVAVTCIYYPGGNTSGQRSYTFSGIVTSVEETSEVSDKVTFSFSILATGAVTPAVI